MSVFTVLERLAPHIEREVNLVLNSEEEVDALVNKLKKIQIGLEDAERQGATNASVNHWLKEIEDVAFEMEDVLDEWEMENLRVELEGSPEEDLPNLWEKVRSFFNSLCRCFTHVADRREIVKKMKALSARLDHTLEEKNKYNFQQSASNHSQEFQQRETTSVISEKIYGRDSDIRGLVEKLLLEGGEERGTEVVSIVGLGGAGKTTLAQKLYNHTQVMENFTLRAWVSVPHTFDTLDVARRIVDVFGEDSENINASERLAAKIEQVVARKKFLLVLDDVWMEDHTMWMDLKNCLHGAPGSKILATTRSESVARMMGDKRPHNLDLLSSEYCANILMNHLYRLLELSYFDLSHVLKRCFLSCIVFPKNFKIHVDEIIRIWMACGYLNSRDNIVEKGVGYFQQLATRSFFQKSESDEGDEEKTLFEVHDLVYDFAICLSNDILSMGGSAESGECSSSQRDHKIRTLCVSHVSEEELQLRHLEHIRVLRMNKCGLHKLPREVGNLIHLRYLDLSGNCQIVELPEFVCNLYFLETLVLNDCTELSKLPKRMDKLIKLRHILNERTNSLEEFPQALQQLTGLWTLSQFQTNEASEFGILSNLNQLRGKLYIIIDLKSNSAYNLEEIKKANLKHKTQLQHLQLSFWGDEQTNDVLDALQPPPNLRRLTINSFRRKELSRWIDTTSFYSLKVVTFIGYFSCPNLPPFYKLSALEKLEIQLCGFKSLNMEEFLGIEDGVEDAIITSHGFPKLKKLEFNGCEEWEEWEDIKEGEQYSTLIMPCLQQLTIQYCYKLNVLPQRLLQHVAASLMILDISGCSATLRSRYSLKEGGSDWDKISRIPYISTGLS